MFTLSLSIAQSDFEVNLFPLLATVFNVFHLRIVILTAE